jgi:microcystin-dependent protein
VWLDPDLSYKFVLKTSADVTQWTVDNVVGTLTPAAVTTAALADGCVTTIKIADLNVTEGKLAALSVTEGKIGAAAVTSSKMAASAIALSAPPGVMFEYPVATAPTGFLLCDGARVSRTTYASLYAIIGTTHGSGDGSTTFNVPDRRGYFPRGTVNFAAKTFGTTDVDTGTEVITVTSHGINRSGFRIRFTSSGTLPAGLSTGTTYYAIYASANTFQVASSEANAIAGTAINLTDQGSGTHTVSQYMDIDAASRTAGAAGGATGDAAGSVQSSATLAHNHSVTDGGHGHSFRYLSDEGGAAPVVQSYLNHTDFGGGNLGSTNSAYNGTATASVVSNTTGITIANSTGNETRPDNIGTYWIIKT